MPYLTAIKISTNPWTNPGLKIDEKTQTLNDKLDQILKKSVITEIDKDELKQLYKQKVAEFSKNILELGKFHTKLFDQTRQGFISRSNLEGILNEDKYIDYLFDHPQTNLPLFKVDFVSRLNNSNLSQDKKESLLKLWLPFKDLANPANKKELLAIKTELLGILKETYKNGIVNTPIRPDLDFRFSADIIQDIKKQENVLDIEYPYGVTGADWKNYLKTTSFILEKNDSLKTAAKTLLFWQSSIYYNFNEMLDSSIHTIKSKRGDCTEFCTILYENLKQTSAKNIKIIYLSNETVEIGHAFVTFEHDGLIYIADHRGIISTDNFYKGFKQKYPEIMEKISSVNIDRHLNPLKYGKSYKIKMENINDFKY